MRYKVTINAWDMKASLKGSRNSAQLPPCTTPHNHHRQGILSFTLLNKKLYLDIICIGFIWLESIYIIQYTVQVAVSPTAEEGLLYIYKRLMFQ